MSTNVLRSDATTGEVQEVAVLTPLDTSTVAAASKIPLALTDGTLDASWGIGGGGAGGGGVFDAIVNAIATNPLGSVIDSIMTSGVYKVFLYFGKGTVAGWVGASSSYTVPTGKKLLVLWCDTSWVAGADPTSRRMRFRNTTDSTDVLYEQPMQYGGPAWWDGDTGTPGIRVVPAGKTVRLERYNIDGNARDIGGYVITKEVDA